MNEWIEQVCVIVIYWCTLKAMCFFCEGIGYLQNCDTKEEEEEFCIIVVFESWTEIMILYEQKLKSLKWLHHKILVTMVAKPDMHFRNAWLVLCSFVVQDCGF